MASARSAALGELVETCAVACFHCGLPLGDGGRFSVRYRDRDEPLCCAGCETVARTIIAGGFDAYYAHRSGAASRVEAPVPTLLADLKLYEPVPV